MAMARLTFEGLQHEHEIVDKDGRFYENPEGWIISLSCCVHLHACVCCVWVGWGVLCCAVLLWSDVMVSHIPILVLLLGYAMDHYMFCK